MRWSDLLEDAEAPSAAASLPALEMRPEPHQAPHRARTSSRRPAAKRDFARSVIERMSDGQVRRLLCKARWPDGIPRCPRCEGAKTYAITTRALFKCARCSHQFSVTSGTPWHGTKLSLKQLLTALQEFAASKAGVTTEHLAGKVGIDPKTALVFCQKVRECTARSQSTVLLREAVEIDATFFVPSVRRPNLGRSAPRLFRDKSKTRCVLTLSQRGGPTVAMVVSGETKSSVRTAVRQHVGGGTQIYTDGHNAYTFLRAYFPVDQASHAECYAAGYRHVNNCESFHARLKRSVKWIYRRVATGRDFDLYVAEMAFRHSFSRLSDREQALLLLGTVLRSPRSERFTGYWQRRRPPPPVAWWNDLGWRMRTKRVHMGHRIDVPYSAWLSNFSSVRQRAPYPSAR